MALITTQEQLNEQLVFSLNWTQESGEYAAVAHQAFNAAQAAFDKALASGVKNPAVSVNLDETLLDNSAYEAGLVGSSKQYSPEDYSRWILSENSLAIPGAVDFVNYVNAKGGKIFFISDRPENSAANSSENDIEQATIENLKNLGFTGASDQTVLLKGEFADTADSQTSGSESFRQAVEEGRADGIEHPLVVLVGDDLNDLNDSAGFTNSNRRAYVQANKDRYNIYQPNQPAYIVLPNVQSGTWEANLYDPEAFGKVSWTQLTPTEKNIQRKEALNTWQPATGAAALVPPGKSGPQDRLNEQFQLALNWTQTSGEFDAIAYGAYATAKQAFDQAITSGAKNPAVVLDIDEAVLNNSAYEAWTIGKEAQFSFPTWEQWIRSQSSTAIPGAVDFINYVNANGGKVFFTADRTQSSTTAPNSSDLEQATVGNLNKIGIAGANQETVLMSGEFPGGTVNGIVNTASEFRRLAVQDGSADNIKHTIVALVGENLNDFSDQAGLSNSDRWAYVESNSDRFGVYQPGKPAYISIPNPYYGGWGEFGLYNPAAFGKTQWFQLTPTEKNLQRKQTLTRWTPETETTYTGVPETLNGQGGQKIFEFERLDSFGLVANFKGVETGVNPDQETISEVDTLKFDGEGLTAKNLLLTQTSNDVVVGFQDIPDTQVLLKNVKLEDLDNLTHSTGTSADVGNFLFNGQNSIEDSFDVISADITPNEVLNRDTVTFLNDLDNQITGLDNSADVINGQGGNDVIYGLSGDDVLRGGSGNDTLIGGKGDDFLYGGEGIDRYVLTSTAGTDTIADFSIGIDKLALSRGLAFDQLVLYQGDGFTAIKTITANEVLAKLIDIKADSITSADFVTA